MFRVSAKSSVCFFTSVPFPINFKKTKTTTTTTTTVYKVKNVIFTRITCPLQKIVSLVKPYIRGNNLPGKTFFRENFRRGKVMKF